MNREPLRLGLRIPLAIAAASWLACASGPSSPPASKTAAATDGRACDPRADRRAILAMAGTFHVSFSFNEVESLTPGYEVKKPYLARATEAVEVVEQSERRIVLQHVLMVNAPGEPPEAQKHWRQDWTFEDRDLLEFRGRRIWEHRALSPEQTACTWSQAVYEVDDGPRYESFGRWVHEGGKSTWTSAETWRPLPRREYTKRSDYDVLLGVNRHVVDASGWTHEQDNRKWVLEPGHALARESGVDRYERVDDPKAHLARDYLEKTGPFWSDVRATWGELLAEAPRLRILQEVDGKPLYERLFPLAEELGSATEPARSERVRREVAPYVSAAPAAAPKPAAVGQN